MIEELPMPADDWEFVLNELARLRTLPNDWDGEGSPAPLPELVSAAARLARDMQARRHTPPGRVFASQDGTVYFEWYTPLGYQEVEIRSPSIAECRRLARGSDVTELRHLPIPTESLP
jgi:hypothetical protein